MITKDDINEGGFNTMKGDGSDDGGRYYVNISTSRAFPRFCFVNTNRTEDRSFLRYFLVDGWRYDALDDAIAALNMPPMPPLDLRAAVDRKKQDPRLKDPAVRAKELAKENRFRWKVYAGKIRKPADQERLATRIAITELLQEECEREAAKGDLFGGSNADR